MGLGGVGDCREVVDRACVHLAGLCAHDRGLLARFERRAERLGVEATLRVRSDRLGRAEPEQPQRAVDRDVALLAAADAHTRCAPPGRRG
jgi:hypothetical protein